jgi:ATP-dependent RNA helicase DDX1
MKGQGQAYGAAREVTGVTKEVTERLEGIRQNVEALAGLEVQAQTSFLMLKRRWNTAMAS